MTTPDAAGVVITLPEIYAEVRAMSKTVSRVDSTLTEFRSEVNDKIADHETRIRADEAARWPRSTLAVWAAVVAAAAAFGALFITR